MKTSTIYLSTQALQKGFTLLEALVALLILSIGLLGLAGMQGTGMHNNHTAYLRSIAIQQAYDMSDRMRANIVAVDAGSYNNIPTGIGTAGDCITTTCSTAQIATFDAFEWNTTNAALLPSGTGTVTRVGSQFTITVMYDEERTGVTGTACGGVSSVDLKCISITTQL